VKTAPEAGTPGAGRPFHDWLAQELRRRGISQRQLAARSGVDQSTISRLLRDDRWPSLRTATLLVTGLRLSSGHPAIPVQDTSTRSAPARVEDALRSDDQLSGPEIRAVMSYYLGIRRSAEK
jgi:transcriptional regulator with XRE-family HTH domain